MKTALVIDGNYLAHRQGRTGNLATLETKDGFPTGVIFGILRSVFKVLDSKQFNRVVFVQDAGKSKRRQMLFPGYKVREVMGKDDEDDKEGRTYLERFYLQMNKLETLLPQLRIRNSKVWKKEGDDVCYQVGKMLNDEGYFVSYMSDDRDFIQLLDYSPNCEIVRPMANEVVTHENCARLTGVSPEWFLTLKAMCGDGSDKIPQIAEQAGEATYLDLIKEAIRQEVTPQEFTGELMVAMAKIAWEWWDESVHTSQQWRMRNITEQSGRNLDLNRLVMDLRAEEFDDKMMGQMMMETSAPLPPFNITGLIKEFTTLEFKTLSHYLVKPNFRALG